jgi:hypothetical protein
MTPVYLVTWRVARRFGMRGLTVCDLDGRMRAVPGAESGSTT